MFLGDAVSPSVNVKLILNAILNQVLCHASSAWTEFFIYSQENVEDAARVRMNNTQHF